MSKNSTVTTHKLVITRLFLDFFKSEKFSRFLLIGCTGLSLLLANSSWGDAYAHFWHQPLAGLTVELWINDGLMANNSNAFLSELLAILENNNGLKE